jgi:hypothetical protein
LHSVVVVCVVNVDCVSIVAVSVPLVFVTLVPVAVFVTDVSVKDVGAVLDVPVVEVALVAALVVGARVGDVDVPPQRSGHFSRTSAPPITLEQSATVSSKQSPSSTRVAVVLAVVAKVWPGNVEVLIGGDMGTLVGAVDGVLAQRSGHFSRTSAPPIAFEQSATVSAKQSPSSTASLQVPQRRGHRL